MTPATPLGWLKAFGAIALFWAFVLAAQYVERLL